MTACPLCRTEHETLPIHCGTCGYPFEATPKEQSKFVAQEILKSRTISNASKYTARARWLIWLSALVNFGMAYYIYSTYQDYYFNGSFFVSSNPFVQLYFPVTLYIIHGITFTFLGFVTFKRPFEASLIALMWFLTAWIAQIIQNPIDNLFGGLLFNIFILGVLFYATRGVYIERNLRRESDFLKSK